MNSIFLNDINLLAKFTLLATFSALFTCLGDRPVRAEPVADSTTGTNVPPSTSVTIDNRQFERFDIDGGTRSGDNLYHSFEKFGLTQDQIANFMSNPNIRNILGRVTGGDASVINGLIQVTGGDSNLFLMNPAGIIFGQDASLDLPASFTATTANGIEIGDYWFDALGNNDYGNLVGNPSGFAFAVDEAGSIVNAGNISVPQGETINLVGGLVINTGTLEAPEGKINITAIPEQQLVKISPEGSLLSLALPTDAANTLSAGAELVTPQALPALLTGGNLQQATGVEIADNGTIKLTGSEIEIPSDPGTAIASSNINASGNTGGNINVLGEKVGVVAANIDASGTNGGGEILIGGDYKGEGEVANALRTFIDRDSVINADAVTSGNGGRVIAWADEVTAFYGNITAAGGSESGDGGFVEVSGKDSLIFEGDVNLTALKGSDGMLLLDPKNITIGPEEQEQQEDNSEVFEILIDAPPDDLTIPINRLAGKNVTLEATNNITFARNTLVNTNGEAPEFIGALIENFDERTPAQDVPVFQSLKLKVDPLEGKTGTINIFGSFAVRENLDIENTNGDINIDLTLPNTILFNNNNSVALPDTRGSIFVGIDSLRFGVSPSGGDRRDVGKANITAPRGNVDLQGGITLNADSDLTIEAQRFTATNPVTLRGNGNGGQPGRQGENFDPDPNSNDNRDNNNLTGEEVSFNIGVAYFGGNVKTITDNGMEGGATDTPVLDENGEAMIEKSDSKPNVEFTVLFPNGDSNSESLEGDLNTEETAEIKIVLLDDVFFEFGGDGDFAQSGIEADIQRFFRVSTDGSIGGGSQPFGNTSFQDGLFDDDQLAQEELDVEVVAVNQVDKTQKASFCSEELNIASIAGSNKLKATCGKQALAYVFTQPTDEDGNPIEISEDLFPELLTGDEFVNPGKDTSWDLWQFKNLKENPIELGYQMLVSKHRR